MILKAITFDFLETILDGHSRNDLFVALGKVAQKDKEMRSLLLDVAQQYGTKRREDVRQLKQSTLIDLIETVAEERGKKVEPKELLELSDDVFEEATATAKLFDDVQETLTALKERKLSLGILSNVSFPGKYYDELLGKLGIAHFFDAVVWSSDVKIRKPAPEIFTYVLGEMHVKPDEALHVGNIPNRDVRGAHDAGMRAIWINRGGVGLQAGEEQADYTVETLNEIINVVDKLRE